MPRPLGGVVSTLNTESGQGTSPWRI